MGGVEIPCDALSGKLTGTRIHTDLAFEKETDASSVWLYRALTMGGIPRATFSFFRINDGGQEEEYFRIHLEKVIIDEFTSFFTGPGSAVRIKRNHVFIGSYIVNDDECSVLFNGYITVSREF